MQLQGVECKGNDGIDRRRHVTLACMRGGDPIAEATRLRTTPPDIRKRQSANEDAVALSKNEEGVPEITPMVLEIAFDAPTK